LLEGSVLTEIDVLVAGSSVFYITSSLRNADMNAVLGGTIVIGSVFHRASTSISDLLYRTSRPKDARTMSQMTVETTQPFSLSATGCSPSGRSRAGRQDWGAFLHGHMAPQFSANRLAVHRPADHHRTGAGGRALPM
jgi:hypothetical protein